ncbi:unnamed protein product, partial [Rotaria sp. Silwood2]
MEVDITSGLEFNSDNQIQLCKNFESEPETTTTTTEAFSSSIERSSTDTQQKPKSASKSKRTYLINRHIEQIGHKRLLAFEDKEKSRSMREFITPSTLLTKLTAAELSLVYHGVHHGHSY